MSRFELDDAMVGHARIKVLGVGGGGGNAINTMITGGLDGVEFIAGNTDSQVLIANLASTKIQLGENLTRGLGAGGNPDVGRDAALEQRELVAEILAGADMVFVTAGMGGGTGTGAAPVVAHISREMGMLTVGVVTRPFIFEGPRRSRQADDGIAALAQAVDCLLVIPNQKLLQIAGQRMAATDAFRLADEVLLNAVRGICDIITVPGLINVDFADVRTIMTNKGRALMGTGRGSGERGAVDAAQQALSSPLLEDTSIDGATGILVNITGSAEMTLNEIAEATDLITRAAHKDAHIIFGSVVNPNLRDEVHITVIATGFDQMLGKHAASSAPAAQIMPAAAAQRRTQMPLQIEAEVDFGQGADPITSTGRMTRPSAPLPRASATPAPFVDEDLSRLDTPTYLRKHVVE